LDLLFTRGADGAWKVDRYRARLIPVTAEAAPDPAVAQVIDRYWQPIASRYGEVIGQAAGDFASRGDDRAEYNLMADAIRETFGTEFELENLGGVRSPLVAGPVTRGDLVTMDPFSNTIVTFNLTGRELKQILQRYSPAVSGIRYRVENKTLVDAAVGGSPVDDDRTYTGASNSYFAGFALKEIQVQDTGKPRLDVLVDYIVLGTVGLIRRAAGRHRQIRPKPAHGPDRGPHQSRLGRSTVTSGQSGAPPSPSIARRNSSRSPRSC
jgi:2',3'-cyclic-nucleotide 2'-phosphodiesterase (5'-nucleotidase family)